MDVKRKEDFHSAGNLYIFVKGLVFFAMLCFGTFVHAQTMTITATNNGGEVLSPGAPNATTFRVAKSLGGILPNYDVTYTVAGTATEGSDFTALSGTVTVPGGGAATFVDIVVPITDDSLVEGDETIEITLSPPGVGAGYVLGIPSIATATVADNDLGVVSLSLTPPFDDAASEEGLDQGLFRINLDNANASGTPLTVNYTITGTASNGGDYNLSGAVVMTFASDGVQVARNLNVVPIQDTDFEPDETVILTLDSTSDPALFSIGPSNTATVTIADNDCAAGTTAPVLNGDPTAFCDAFSVALDDYFDGTRPPDAGLAWSTNPDPSVKADWIPSPNGSPVSVADTYYAFFTDNATTSCFSPTSQITITQSNSPSAGITTDGVACNNDTGAFGDREVDLDDLISGEDNGSWAQTSGPSVGTIPNNNEVDFEGLPATSYVFTYTTNTAVAPCTNASSTVTIVVSDCDPCVAGDAPPALVPDVPTVFCDDIDVSLNDYTNSTPPAGTALVWTTNQADPTDTNAHLTPTEIADPLPGTYYGVFYDALNDCASPSLQVQLTLNTTPENVQGTPGERCGLGPVDLSATSSTANVTFNWYNSLTGNDLAGTGANFSPNLSATTTFYLEATRNGCATSPRIPITATIFPEQTTGTATLNSSACSDASNGPTIVDLDDLISGESPGIWTTFSGLAISNDNIVNFEGADDGNYVFTYTTTDAQDPPCQNVSVDITISVNDCDVDSDLDGLFDGPEAILGTNPNNPDTDGDGINDGDEVGSDVANPLDSDIGAPDGIIDALDSNILDEDNDGVVDQLDPANTNPCLPDNTNNLCDTDGDGISDGQEIADGTDPLDACDPNLTPDCEPAPIDLEITKVVDNENGVVGEQVFFTVTANNLSDSKILGIKIAELLESGFEYVSHEASLGSYNVEAGQWEIFEMTALQSATLNITVNIVEGGVYTNTAELLESFPVDGTPANDSATVTVNVDLPEGVDLVLEKSALSARPLIGDEVVFTIKVTNKSIEDTVSQIQIRDVISEDGGFVYRTHETALGTYDPTTGIWIVPELVKDQEALLTLTVQVPNEGTFTNTAKLIRSSPVDGNPANNEATAEVRVSLPTPAEDGFVFNQFSPNNDGTNDFLKIKGIGTFGNTSIEIFNRYGNRVFEDRNMTDDNVWDGTWENKEVPDGTYYYLLDLGDGTEIRKGWIQLIR